MTMELGRYDIGRAMKIELYLKIARKQLENFSQTTPATLSTPVGPPPLSSVFDITEEDLSHQDLEPPSQ